MSDKKYYTYRYAYPQGFIDDTGKDLSGVVFYVGKGMGLRINAHENEAKNGCPCIKCGAIRSIWAKELQVDKAKMLESDDEIEVREHEVSGIQQHSGPYLTNYQHNSYRYQAKLILGQNDDFVGDDEKHDFDWMVNARKNGDLPKFTKGDVDVLWLRYSDEKMRLYTRTVDFVDGFVAAIPQECVEEGVLEEIDSLKEIVLIVLPETLEDLNCSWY